jgi:hypothetical protein
MKNSEWYFSEGREFDSCDPTRFISSYGASYNDVAEEIAEALDHLNACCADEREFWLLYIGHNTPVKMKVTVETVLRYSASVAPTSKESGE